MNSPRERLTQGRPVIGAALLLIAALSIAALLFEGTRAPADIGLPRFRGADKLLHFAAHAWVSALMFWGLMFIRFTPELRPSRASGRRALLAALAVLLIDIPAGVAVELVQAHLGSAHGRVFDWKDIAANVAGTVAALSLSGLAVRAIPDAR